MSDEERVRILADGLRGVMRNLGNPETFQPRVGFSRVVSWTFFIAKGALEDAGLLEEFLAEWRTEKAE